MIFDIPTRESYGATQKQWTDSMDISTEQFPNHMPSEYSMSSRSKRCISCGTDRIKPGRRYCSKVCRQQMNWVLSLSKGLLRTCNVRYAAFSFTREHIILDLLPVWSNEISRFLYSRTPDTKPAEDLKNLILQSGREWHRMVENRNSKSRASLLLLKKNYDLHQLPEKG